MVFKTAHDRERVCRSAHIKQLSLIEALEDFAKGDTVARTVRDIADKSVVLLITPVDRKVGSDPYDYRSHAMVAVYLNDVASGNSSIRCYTANISSCTYMTLNGLPLV